jgi:hypothetical protein
MDKHSIIQQNVANIRGSVIQNCVMVEKIMDEFISGYFCKENLKEDLMTFLLCTERITFRGKSDIFKLIIEKKENAARFAEFKKENPSIHNEITEYILEERNIFAHYLLDTAEGYIDRYEKHGIIRFIKFKVSKEKPAVHYLEYNNDRIQKIHKTIIKCGDAIIKLNQIL